MVETRSKIIARHILIDELINTVNFNSCHLSVQIGMDGLALGVMDTLHNKYVAFEAFAFQSIFNSAALSETIVKTIRQHSLVGDKGFQSVSVAYVNRKSTLVPKPLFDNTLKEQFLTFNISLGEEEEVLSDSLKNTAAVNVYAIPVSIHKAVKRLFPNARMVHFSSVLLDSLVLQNKNTPVPRLICHVQSAQFELINVDNGKLIYYNSFEYQTIEDLIYYVLFVCEQLKRSPEEVELLVVGEVEKKSALMDMLNKYMRFVALGSRPNTVSYSYKIDELPSQFYFNLFNQYLCV